MKNKIGFILFFFPLLQCWADFKLNVERFEQKYQYSCETAALRIVLNFHGIQLSEDEIIKRMPFESTENKNGVWGDPDKGFVGKIDGHSSSESYGIHWKPLKELATHWKKAELLEQGTKEDLISNLMDKKPIIVWIYTGKKTPLQWKTTTGKPVKALLEEHTVVISGFKGNKYQVEGFYISDPSKKNVKFLETSKFLEVWSGFENKGLVVQP